MRLLSLLLTAVLLLTGCSRSQPPAQEEETPPSSVITEEIPESEAEAEPEPEPVPEETESELLLCSYLPVASLSEPLENFQTNIDALDYLILNTGVYWNSEGKLEISDDFISVWETLHGQTELWCTVNPKGELIREQTAGTVLDTAEERKQLVQSIADFAAEYQLSGIDIDWEFPLETEWADFFRLSGGIGRCPFLRRCSAVAGALSRGYFLISTGDRRFRPRSCHGLRPV